MLETNLCVRLKSLAVNSLIPLVVFMAIVNSLLKKSVPISGRKPWPLSQMALTFDRISVAAGREPSGFSAFTGRTGRLALTK